jgi:hypothetical protein
MMCYREMTTIFYVLAKSLSCCLADVHFAKKCGVGATVVFAQPFPNLFPSLFKVCKHLSGPFVWTP